jgi:glycosyltransferase involved in cell wall biosynthesis
VIKQLLPKSFKQFLWFVFKSPQRHWHELGYSTLFTDFKAWWSVKTSPSKLQPITICIGIKNRSHNLLNYLITSLNQCEYQDLIAISIFDCGSNDVPDLKSVIESKWKGQLLYTTEEQAFARTIAFNKAVKQAKTELILVCDADMSVPKDIVKRVNHYVTKHSAWFPHVWYTNEDGSGRYYTESTGMMASYQSQFLATGGYDESIKQWGYEDWYLFFAFYKHGIGCIRSNEKDFVHHYHPSLKPEGFKPLF